VGGAKRALRNDQQRENEKREEKRDHKNSRQNFEERSAKGALRNEQQVLRRDGRKQKEERREKRASGRQLDSLHFYMVREGRDGAEKGRALGERTEERKEKQEGKDNHNQDERAAEGNSLVQAWCRKGSRLLGEESIAGNKVRRAVGSKVDGLMQTSK